MKTVVPAWDLPAVPVEGTEARFPVRHVYCVGRNYAEHAAEMGGDATKEPPFFFMKAADTILPVARGEVGRMAYPQATKSLHHEVELVVAIGKGKILEDGTVRPLDVKVGDKILFGKYSGTEVKVDGEELVVMREEDVMAVIEGK